MSKIRDDKPAYQCGVNVLVQNSTSFPVQVSARLRALFSEYTSLSKKHAEGEETSQRSLAAAALKYYQFLVREVLSNPEYGVGECGNARGLLVYHTMGMGKTFLAVASAIALWDVRMPVILAPKSLQKNFKQTIEQYVAIMNPGLDEKALAAKQLQTVKRFRFVSLDAYNMATQMAKVTSGVGGTGALNNRLLIVDEAHNLFRAIINSPSEKTNARRLYEMVMEAKNLRILFLTGTVPSKDPFELVPCFNMLAGYDLLPTQYEVFYKYYVDQPGKKIRHRNKLANRLMGMVSHVTHTLPSDPGTSSGESRARLRETGGFPEELETVVERVEMSPEQYRQYLLAREKEEAEGKGSGGFAPTDRIANTPALSLPGAEAGVGSTYYVKSRSLSNFAPPRDLRGKAVTAMPATAFTAETSPKIARLVANLAKAEGPTLVYSQFVDVGGLAAIERFLQKAGYSEFHLAGQKREGPHYAVISGAVKPDDRAKIQGVFNSRKNAHGELIKALLVSKTGAEGLDLKGVRQVHLLEPYWDKSREDQVKARGVRLGSHDHLPGAEREVQPFLYMAVANKKMFEGMRPTKKEGEAPPRRYKLIEEETVDEKFHKRALLKQSLNLAFRRLLRDVCLECAINGYGGCRQCVPTDAPLFHEDPTRDLRIPDPCQPLKETEIAVEEIVLPPGTEGEKAITYYYREDTTSPFGVNFFEYNEELEAYSPIDSSTGLFMRLYKVYEAKKK
jgi:hypothetical protein